MAYVWIIMRKIFFTLTAALLLGGCILNFNQENAQQNDSDKKETENTISTKIVKLGFCPTMLSDVENIKKNNENIKVVPFASAGEVLTNLKAGEIDFALIGRKAKRNEIGENILEKKLFETGFTFIAPKKSFIPKNDLANLEIKTCLEKEDTRIHPSYFTDLKNIIYHQHPNCKTDGKGVWLISWDDWNDDMELLIPEDEYGNKIKKYRSPFLYGENLHALVF